MLHAMRSSAPFNALQSYLPKQPSYLRCAAIYLLEQPSYLPRLRKVYGLNDHGHFLKAQSYLPQIIYRPVYFSRSLVFGLWRKTSSAFLERLVVFSSLINLYFPSLARTRALAPSIFHFLLSQPSQNRLQLALI